MLTEEGLWKKREGVGNGCGRGGWDGRDVCGFGEGDMQNGSMESTRESSHLHGMVEIRG